MAENRVEGGRERSEVILLHEIASSHASLLLKNLELARMAHLSAPAVFQ